jgi:predicted PurR-regulated permease PerM
MNKIIKVEITPKTILTTLAILALCWLITKIYSILFIALIYILFISTIILLILVSYRPLFTQLEEFVRTLPDLVVNVVNTIVTKVPFIRDKFNWDEILNNLKENFWANLEISKLSNYFVSGVGKAFGFVGSIFLFISFIPRNSQRKSF